MPVFYLLVNQAMLRFKSFIYQRLSTITPFMYGSFTKNTDGTMTKYTKNVKVCIDNVTILSLRFKMKDPRNTKRNPMNSTSHARIVI